MPQTPINDRRIALVLGGGGMKGFAHLGVLRALEERNIRPALYAGTSVGALLASAYAGGLSVDEMAQRAAALRRRDLFRLNHVGMILERARSAAIYQEEPLRALCRACVPNVRFDELPATVLVNTVDVERGTQVVWGLPGLRNVRVDEAVYASCALPGFFPPGQVDGRLCIDGGTIDNLPVAVAGHGADAIIAVDVGSSDLTHATDIGTQGFATIYMRAATLMMHALQQAPLDDWIGPPMLLIRPRIGHVGWFSFGHTDELIREGYRAATEALEQFDAWNTAQSGIFPRRVVKVEVDRDRCSGCGICVALAPHAMGMDSTHKAYALAESVDWSPADGDFVRQCPTVAIQAKRVVPVLDSAA